MPPNQRVRPGTGRPGAPRRPGQRPPEPVTRKGRVARVAARQRAERRRRMVLVAIPVAVVVALIAALAVVATLHKSTNKPITAAPAPAALVSQITNLPPTVYGSDATGGVKDPLSKISGQKPLVNQGKPEVFYLGAEYCPYCAAERWAMIVALSRFGTFANLSTIASSPGDIYPNTHTFTFYGATYTSKYLSFVPVEQYTNVVSGNFYKPLQALTASQTQLVSALEGSGGSIPLIDFGNQYALAGASYSPAVLAGESWTQIAAEVNQPNSAIAKAVGGTANWLTAALCQLTHGQPASVCSTPAVTSLQGQLGG